MLDIERIKDEGHLHYLDLIKNHCIKDFLIEVISEYSTEEKIIESDKVLKVYFGMLRRKNQINNNGMPTWIELSICAGYIHNLFYDGTVTSLFKARELLARKAVRHGIPFNGVTAIFQTVEAQFGDKSPVEVCIPSDASPNALFAWACWFVEELNGDKETPSHYPY